MDATHQQIKHVSTLHQLHRRRHKRYRESALAEAIDDLIQMQPPPRLTLRQRIDHATWPITAGMHYLYRRMTGRPS